MSSTWTDERAETCKTLWNDGKSAAEIARALGGTSRNAVIGKVHRMGLHGGDSHSTEPRRTRPKPRVRTVIQHRAEILAAGEPPPLNMDMEAFSRGTKECRYPHGDGPAFLFCGHPVKGGSPYCEFHHAVARVPIVPTATARNQEQAMAAERANGIKKVFG